MGPATEQAVPTHLAAVPCCCLQTEQSSAPAPPAPWLPWLLGLCGPCCWRSCWVTGGRPCCSKVLHPSPPPENEGMELLFSECPSSPRPWRQRTEGMVSEDAGQGANAGHQESLRTSHPCWHVGGRNRYCHFMSGACVSHSGRHPYPSPSLPTSPTAPLP